MFQSPSDHSPVQSFQRPAPVWAETLKRALGREESASERRNLYDAIDAWQSAIRGAHLRSGEGRNEAFRTAENVRKWYWNESHSRSYQAPSWRISPERSALFAEFRNDPNYHLKCLVEVVARAFVEASLRSDGMDASVMITSDSDDVFAWVDYVVEIRDPETGKKQYVGIDLAVSENPAYLEKKESRTETVCHEFNAFMRHGYRKIPRQIFAVPPKIMARFLAAYVGAVETGRMPDESETLALFESAKAEVSISEIVERAKARSAFLVTDAPSPTVH